MMQLSTAQAYKHKDIRSFLEICPVCAQRDEVTLWSTMDNGAVKKGKEGITCSRCKLDLSFTFEMDQDNEIIDEYELDYFKIGNLELKNNNEQLVLYFNNTYVKDIASNIVDIHKYRSLVMLS